MYFLGETAIYFSKCPYNISAIKRVSIHLKKLAGNMADEQYCLMKANKNKILMVLYLCKLKLVFTKGCLSQVWLRLARWFRLNRRCCIFKIV